MKGWLVFRMSQMLLMVSPLANGRHAEKFQHLLMNLLGPRVLAKQFQSQEVRLTADVPEDLAITLGFELATHQKLVAHRDSGHMLVWGRTGAGKTSFIVWVIGQLVAQGTHESSIDVNYLSRIQRAGADVIGIIVTRDGFVRFFTVEKPFQVEVQGNGVSQVDENVFQITLPEKNQD